jgi:hypothetical protein
MVSRPLENKTAKPKEEGHEHTFHLFVDGMPLTP